MISTTKARSALFLLLALVTADCRQKEPASARQELSVPEGAKVIALPGGSLGGTPTIAEAGFDPSGTVALLGTGYNASNSTVRGQCVDGSQPQRTETPPNADQNGQLVTYDFRQATEVSQLRKSLNVDVNQSFGIGIYSGSGSAHFFESSAIDSMSSYLIVDVKVINQVQVLTRLRMAEFAKAKMSDPDAFRRACGDHFVEGMRTGGQFTAVVRFSARSEEYKRQLDANLAGKISEFYSGSLSFSQMLKSLSSTSNFTIEVLRKGASEPLPSLNDLDAYARSFPTKVSPKNGSPWPIEAILNDYDVVEDYDGKADFTYPIAVSFMERLAEARDEAVGMRNDISIYRTNPDDFGAVDKDKALADERALNLYLTQLTQLAATCSGNPQTGCTATIPPLPPVSTKPGDNNGNAPAGKVAEMEALFEKRGNPVNVDSLIAGLSDAALQPMTLRDRYRARTLLARAYLWRVMWEVPFMEYPFKTAEPAPGVSEIMNDDVMRFRMQLTEAANVVAKMPSLGNATCELGYLRVADEFLKRPLPGGPDAADFDKQTPGMISRLEALRATTTIDKKPCESFDYGGIDRNLARLNDETVGRLLAQNQRDEAKARWFTAASQIRKANLLAPGYPGNILPTMMIAMHGGGFTADRTLMDDFCRSFTGLARNPTPAAYAGLDPKFGVARDFASQHLPGTPCAPH